MPMKAIGTAQNRTKFTVKIPPRALPSNKEEDAFMVVSNFLSFASKNKRMICYFQHFFVKTPFKYVPSGS